MFILELPAKDGNKVSFHSCALLAQETVICAKPIQKYLNKLQTYSTGYYLANRDAKNPIVMQIRLTARGVLSRY